MVLREVAARHWNRIPAVMEYSRGHSAHNLGNGGREETPGRCALPVRWLGASRAEAGAPGRSPAEGLGPGRPRAPCRGPGGPAPLGPAPLAGSGAAAVQPGARCWRRRLDTAGWLSPNRRPVQARRLLRGDLNQVPVSSTPRRTGTPVAHTHAPASVGRTACPSAECDSPAMT